MDRVAQAILTAVLPAGASSGRGRPTLPAVRETAAAVAVPAIVVVLAIVAVAARVIAGPIAAGLSIAADPVIAAGPVIAADLVAVAVLLTGESPGIGEARPAGGVLVQAIATVPVAGPGLAVPAVRVLAVLAGTARVRVAAAHVVLQLRGGASSRPGAVPGNGVTCPDGPRSPSW